MSSTVSAIADLVAAIAIILSLCFVAYELHQTRLQSELSNWREVLQSLTDYKAATNDMAFAEFLVRAQKDYKGLSEAEKLSFGMYLEQGVHIYGNFLKHNSSLPNKLEGLDDAIMNSLSGLLETPGGATWWAEAHARRRFMPSTYVIVMNCLGGAWRCRQVQRRKRCKMAKTYSGKDIEISFDMKRCIHARNCFLKLPQVFDPSRKPWVDPDAAPAEEIAAMVRTCPSGALTFQRREAAEVAPGINRAQVLENGPNALHGNLTVKGEAMTRATLCRCGKTKNPPYCDYSHVEAKFEATGEPSETGKDAPGDDAGEALAIIQHENGPVEARGALEITTGTGARVHRGTRAFLCRCGQSSNKPFCDGSHKGFDFEVPGD